MILKKVSLACMVMAGGALLAACGGGGGSVPVATTPVAATNVSANANAAVVGAVGTTPVVFANGFAGVSASGAPVAVTGATTVAFSGSGASPNVSITNGGRTASGVTTFGSCIFTFTASTFTPPSDFDVGKSITVNPCSLNVSTANKSASGGASQTPVTFSFGSATSNSFTQSVTVNSAGAVSVNGVPVGTVTITNVTGGTN